MQVNLEMTEAIQLDWGISWVPYRNECCMDARACNYNDASMSCRWSSAQCLQSTSAAAALVLMSHQMHFIMQ